MLAGPDSPLEYPIVCFLDVGQGSCTVVIYEVEDQRYAFIIDVPKKLSPLLDVLRKHQIRRIGGIVLSHNHDDHAGGIADLITNHPVPIRAIYVVPDHNAEQMRDASNWEVFKTIDRSFTYLEGCRTQFLPIDELKLVMRSEIPVRIQIDGLHPGLVNCVNQLAQPSHQHTVCGVIRIRHVDSAVSVLLPGDASKEAWESIHRRFGKRKANFTAVAAPHHGGSLLAPEDFFAELFSRIIGTKYLVVSVGCNNQHKHPHPKHMEAAANANAEILCTQITPHCQVHVGRLRLPNYQTCAGTIALELKSGRVLEDGQRHGIREGLKTINARAFCSGNSK